ncbi:MAG: dihydrolipoyl dehydrogenase [Candidatus Omnitrophota bacterium]
MNYAYDLAVIGAGWAGFNAALKAKKHGLNVVLIEKEKIGGTCLNRGCIPAKALIQSAKVYSLCQKSAKFGIEIAGSKINFPEVQKRKEAIVGQLGKGIEFMLRDIPLLKGEARFISNEELSVGGDKIKAKHIIIASGSKPLQLPDVKFDGKKIVSSNDVLNLSRIPESLLIIGGGVIGCEFASLFSALGADVTIVELMQHILPQEDNEIAKRLEGIFRKRGIKIYVNTNVKSMDLEEFSLALQCVGRAPELESLDLKKTGILTQKFKLSSEKIVTDEHMNTNIPNIFAAGDCAGGKQLAHAAAHQGRIAVENIIHPGRARQIESRLIPNCIFTAPEVASVGITEQEAGENGIEPKINKFDFLGSGMARIMDEAEGFIKVVSDKNTGGILGGSIIGPKATELIAIMTVAVQSQLKLSQLREIVFAHPTLSESIHEATED